SITIHVRERAPRAPAHVALGESCTRRDVLEATTAVPVEHVPAIVGDEEIRPPVVVVVAGADARRPTGPTQAGSIRYIFEGAVVEISVKAVGWGRAGRIRDLLSCPLLQPRTAQRERVQPAVVVVVDQG